MKAQRLATVVASWVVIGLYVCNVWAQDIKNIGQENAERLKSATEVGILHGDLFGDEISQYTGSLEFVVTDVSLPGNDGLPVVMGRRFPVQPRNGIHGRKLLSDWELEIPHLHGVFPKKNGAGIGWQATIYQQPDLRCNVDSKLTAPPPDALAQQGGIFSAGEYWHGNNLYVPGQGDQEMMVVATDNPHRPTDGQVYRWVAANQWYFSCLSSTANGVPGEAFLARAPDGTRYWFNWFAKRPYATVTKAVGAGPIDFVASPQIDGDVQIMVAVNAFLAREEVWILPTRVEDRFGNYVIYTYDIANPWRVQSIAASDGRLLTFAYDASGFISKASDGTREWTYIYADSGLSKVVLPDSSSWQFSLSGFRNASINYSSDGAAYCGESTFAPGAHVGTMTHPSGAVGTFTVEVTAHGRSYVPKQCVFTGPGQLEGPYAMHPRKFDALALTRKQIQGPGVVPQIWTYAYGSNNSSWAEDCVSDCPSTRQVTITQPDDNWQRHTYGNKFRETEGKLLLTEVGQGSAVLKRTATTYHQDATGQTYPARLGETPQTRSDALGEMNAPIKQIVQTQQATTFTSTVNSFDSFARPTSITQSSTLTGNPTRTQLTEYHDNTAKWVLGQLKKTTLDGVMSAEATYDGIFAAPLTFAAFGKRQQALTYHADGTVATVTDGNNNVTTFGSWKRGIPGLITYADGTTQSAVINDNGWVDAVTDENGFTTRYGYDAMGRVSRIGYFNGPNPVGHEVQLAFVPIASDEHGLPAGHWRQSRYQGNQHINTYFDALWRPVLEEQLDASDIGNTLSQVVKQYDSEGRVVFQSYPLRGVGHYSEANQGIWTEYDALGRVTSVSQDSEQGVLSTLTEYLPNHETRVTDPRGNQTVTGYQSFDQPTYDAPVWIQHPDGSWTQITRDVFGKPLEIVRK